MKTLVLNRAAFQSASRDLYGRGVKKLHFAIHDGEVYQKHGRRWLLSPEYHTLLRVYPSERLIRIEQEPQDGEPDEVLLLLVPTAEQTGPYWDAIVRHYHKERQ